MKNVPFLLKFCERKWGEELQKGNFYFNTPDNFRKIEFESKERGQGDKFDGMMELGTESLSVNIDFGEHTKYRPTLCLTAGFPEDILEKEEKLFIKLPKKLKCDIKSHFPNADTVALIKNPDLLISDLGKRYSDVIADNVIYINNKDKGKELTIADFVVRRDFPSYENKDELLKLLKSKDYQDSMPRQKNGKLYYNITEKNCHNTLFIKDDFFQNQHEFRIILKDHIINKGKTFKVDLSQQIFLYTITELFSDSVEIDI